MSNKQTQQRKLMELQRDQLLKSALAAYALRTLPRRPVADAVAREVRR